MKNLRLPIQCTYKYFKGHALNDIRMDLTVDEREYLLYPKHSGKDSRVNSIILITGKRKLYINIFTGKRINNIWNNFIKKRFATTILSILMAMALLSSCGENDEKESSGSDTLIESEFSREELVYAVEKLSISYSITVISDKNSEVEINSDSDLTSYSKNFGKAKIKFPIKITVNGETILIEDHKELKAFIGRKKNGQRPHPFKLVYPISVNTAEGFLVIADREAMKAYKKSLEKGDRPEFVFPISVKVGEYEIEVNSIETFKKLYKKREKRGYK